MTVIFHDKFLIYALLLINNQINKFEIHPYLFKDNYTD